MRARPIFPIALSLAAAATALKIPPRKIREAVMIGDLHAFQEPGPGGTRIRILVRDLEAWLHTWPRATIRQKISRSK